MNDVLIVEDDQVLRDALIETMQIAGFSCAIAENGKEALRAIENSQPSVILSDIRMDNMDGKALLKEIQRKRPEIPVILMTAYADIDDAVSLMRSGAVDYIQKPFVAQAVTEKVGRYVHQRHNGNQDPVVMDTKSRALMSMALRVAQSDVSVLITGESGTGKEVLAQYIHQHSSRKEKPFIAINCAAIPEQMLEATLFGYEKGAFTGAYKSTAGKFEQAQGGSLLLDEVSEMSLALQAKLLRVLQEKEVERIGAAELIKLDVRILATTNRNLAQEVHDGRFREDLYYRLSVFPLEWMALRERRDDILPLANYLIQRHCQGTLMAEPQLSPQAEQALKNYYWPGNVRELDNVIQRAMVLQSEGLIEKEHLQLGIQEPQAPQGEAVNGLCELQRHEFDLIERTLLAQKGNRSKTADILGISERTLRYKLAKMREEGYVI